MSHNGSPNLIQFVERDLILSKTPVKVKIKHIGKRKDRQGWVSLEKEEEGGPDEKPNM